MDLKDARALVAAAISNGLEYSSDSRLDSPQELFDQLLAEVDRRVAEGLDVVAWWQVGRQYRPFSFGNEIATAVATVADADLPGFVRGLDPVKQSRLQYELTQFALRHAPQARHLQWLELAQTPRLIGLGVACALRALFEAHATAAEVDDAIEGLTRALQSKQAAARSNIWWQLAALAPMTASMHGWSAMADSLWKAASREIEIGEHFPQAYVSLVETLRPQCGMLNGLFARLAVRGGAEVRAEAAAAIRQDFAARLRADEWFLPSLENAPERIEYLPAVGWAIAHDVQTGGEHHRWWEATLSEYLLPVPRWRTPHGWRKRCGLVLLAASFAAHHLLEVSAPEARTFCETLLGRADMELPGLMKTDVGAWHPLRSVPLALASVECLLSAPVDGGRVIRLARLVRRAEGLQEMVEAIRTKIPSDAAWLAELQQMRVEREQYEKQLFPSQSGAVAGASGADGR